MEDLSEEQVQNSAVRAGMEDIVVAACHCMALAHIHMGSADTALTLSKTATEHIRASASFSEPSCREFSSVFKAHQLILSARQLTNIRSNVASLTTKMGTKNGNNIAGGTWHPAEGRHKTDPNLFVPVALRRNLPEGTRSTRTLLGSPSVQFYDYESMFADVLRGDAPRAGTGKGRYSWSGKFDSYERSVVSQPSLSSSDPFASLQPSMEQVPTDLLTIHDLNTTMPKSPLRPFDVPKARVHTSKSQTQTKDGDMLRNASAEPAFSHINTHQDGRNSEKITAVAKGAHRSTSTDPLDTFRTAETSRDRPRVRLAEQDRTKSPLLPSRMYFPQGVIGGKAQVLDPLDAAGNVSGAREAGAISSLNSSQVRLLAHMLFFSVNIYMFFLFVCMYACMSVCVYIILSCMHTYVNRTISAVVL